MRALNARGLASRGYTVLQAGNGVEAIEVLEKSDGRSIWSSPTWSCRRWTGRHCCANCAAAIPRLKVVFVSGYAEDAFQKHLPADGQFDFLPKPFTLKQLVAKVKETLTG